MILIGVWVPREHVQVIRSNIGPESVEKCRDVQMSQFEPISGKKLRDSYLGPFIQTPLYFHDTENGIWKTFDKYYKCNIS
jgi:hypothetical protein